MPPRKAGNYARSFLQLGFNRDEEGRIVFEGMNPHVSPKRKPLNVRFGDPGRASGMQHTENDFAGQESPVTWDSQYDSIAKVTGGVLVRCQATRTCPKILQTVTDTEYWEGAMSLLTTDVAGTRDMPVPANVRIYHFASTQHGGYSPVGPVPPRASPVCQQLPNANSYAYSLRAVIVALQHWVVDDTPPPPSRYARLADGTLVDVAKVGFPRIPKVSANLTLLLNRRALYDRGRTFDGANESGYESTLPPVRVADYRTLVPQVDADGNDLDGVHSLSLLVPLGTYTGWNTRAAGFGEGDACDLIGSFIPFPKTAADAAASGDPRKPVASRYPSTQSYDDAVDAAARTLVTQGFLLANDAAAATAQVKNTSPQQRPLAPVRLALGRDRDGRRRRRTAYEEHHRRRDNAQHAGDDEGRIVAAALGADEPGAVGDQARAELVSGEDPTEHHRCAQTSELVRRELEGRRHRRDPIQAVEHREDRQADARDAESGRQDRSARARAVRNTRRAASARYSGRTASPTRSFR
jgi:hypothetical protein